MALDEDDRTMLDRTLEAIEKAREAAEWAWEKFNELPQWWHLFPRRLEIPVPEIPPPSEWPPPPNTPPGEEPGKDPHKTEDTEDEDEREEDESSWTEDIVRFFAGWLLDWLLSEPCIEVPIDFRLHEWAINEDEEDKLILRSRLIEFAPPVPWAARVGDPVLHGGGATPGPGSTDVLIGGRPALLTADTHVCPLPSPIPHVGGAFIATQAVVMINGRPALRVGDACNEGPAGLNPIIVGCPTVEVGPVPEPVLCNAPVLVPRDPRLPMMYWKKGYIGQVKGTLRVGLSVLGPFATFDGTLTSAYLWGEHEHEWEYSLGDMDHDGKEDFVVHEEVREVEWTIAEFDVDGGVYPLFGISWWKPGAPKTTKKQKKISSRTRIVDEEGNDKGEYDEDYEEPEPEEIDLN